MDLNDVKAGKYQLVAQRWDQITSKPGEPLDYVRHRRGDIVDLNTEDAKRLVAAGAVVKPGQLEKTRAEQARAVAERAQREYEAILAGLPEDVRGDVTASRRDGGSGTAGDSGQGAQYVEGSDPADFNVGQIEAYVGDDQARAADVLAREQARGDKARSSLVKKLEGIANPS